MSLLRRFVESCGQEMAILLSVVAVVAVLWQAAKLVYRFETADVHPAVSAARVMPSTMPDCRVTIVKVSTMAFGDPADRLSRDPFHPPVLLHALYQNSHGPLPRDCVGHWTAPAWIVTGEREREAKIEHSAYPWAASLDAPPGKYAVVAMDPQSGTISEPRILVLR